MSKGLSDEALDQLFREARTHTAWLDKPVTDDTLRQLYDVMKWGPTSANSGSFCLSALAAGQGETTAGTGAG